MSVIISVVSSIDVISLSLNYNDLQSSDMSPLYDMIDPNCAWNFVRNLADMLKFYLEITRTVADTVQLILFIWKL